MIALPWTILSAMIFLVVPMTAVGQSPVTKWTSTDGKTIKAALIHLVGEHVVLQRPDGSQFSVPLNRLSPESQAVAQNGEKLPPPDPKQIAFDKGATFYITLSDVIDNDATAHFYSVNLASNPAKPAKPFAIKIEWKSASGRTVQSVVKPSQLTPGPESVFVFGIMQDPELAEVRQGSIHLIAEDSKQRLSNTITIPIRLGK